MGVESQERLDGRGTKRFILERGERLYAVVREVCVCGGGQEGLKQLALLGGNCK